MMTKITLYTGDFCHYCHMAKRLLQQIGVPAKQINEIRVDTDPHQFAQMQQLSGRRTIPQIFIGDTHIGGFSELYELHRQNGLLPLLNTENANTPDSA